MKLDTYEERKAYIEACELSVKKQREEYEAMTAHYKKIEDEINKYIADAVAVINQPLLDLIRDIKAMK